MLRSYTIINGGQKGENYADHRISKYKETHKEMQPTASIIISLCLIFLPPLTIRDILLQSLIKYFYEKYNPLLYDYNLKISAILLSVLFTVYIWFILIMILCWQKFNYDT